jgi:hypothetical protein
MIMSDGRCCGMEMNVDKNKVMRISRQPSPIQIVTEEKKPENVEYFRYLGSLITNDTRYTPEIKSRIVKQKKLSRSLFTSKLD